MFAVLVLLVLSFLAWEVLGFYRRRASLPPGPFAVPLLGNFINEVKLPYVHVALRRLSARFGPVFTVHLPYPVVNIADYATIRDTYRGNDVTGRNFNIIGTATNMIDNGGIALAEGADWQEQRRFVIATLRDFGMGKNLMEEKVRLSAKSMVDYIDKQKLESVDLAMPVQVFVCNIINEFLFGTQYSHEDSGRLMDFVQGLTDSFESMASSPIVNVAFMLPWIVHLPVVSYFWKKHQQRFQKVNTYICESAAQVKNDPSEEPACYVQAFRKNSKDKREGQLLSCCVDLFIAGQETTTTTMKWAMLFLAGHPDVQEKFRAEIFSVIGRDRAATMADKVKMPYASALLNEIQRCANIIAPNPVLFHKATVDTVIAGRFQGHKVPAGTIVNGDLHQIMQTDPVFEQPARFWPERYLAEDRVTLRKELVDRTIPFGIGKRQCAGEGLARTELFIGLCTFIQKFRIFPLPGRTIDFEPLYTAVHMPRPQNFRLERV